MEYVLVDIKNFLKKLENGQLEIEAGQWELQKALTNMTKVVSDLKNLRDDVEDVRVTSMQQMNLIKELQMQLDKMNMMQGADQPVTVSESSVEYERVYKRPVEVQGTPKGFKKRKCRIRSEEIIEITSQVSNDKSESGVQDSLARNEQCPAEPEDTEFATTANERNSDEESCHKTHTKDSYAIPKTNQNMCHYTAHTGNNDMLQRYLKDSVKYIERKASNSTQATQQDSREEEGEKTNSTEYTPFWDEYSSRAPPDYCENRNAVIEKDTSATVMENPLQSNLPKRFLCSKCPRKFIHKSSSCRRERKHKAVEALYCAVCGKSFRNSERLRDHESAHRISRSFKGFRCSYCGKLCSSPESLTEHLRKCRIIMKAHHRKCK